MKIEDVKVGMRVKTDVGPGIIESVVDGVVSVTTRYGYTIERNPCDVFYNDDYVVLQSVLSEAITRASEGKGKDRHANGNPFDEQPIVALNLSLGSQDGPLFQIQKKCAEASRFYASGERERAENELLDCIVYAAGAVITGRKRT